MGLKIDTTRNIYLIKKERFYYVLCVEMNTLFYIFKSVMRSFVILNYS
jgi:hypothetical protein